MDRENSLTLLWPEWALNPIPSDPQSAVCSESDVGSMGYKIILTIIILDADMRFSLNE
jgi:hypothetical protein